jgi:hypothetical protein
MGQPMSPWRAFVVTCCGMLLVTACFVPLLIWVVTR